MTVSTLYALETIFFLRLQLAQIGWDEKEPIYESLCRNRFEQIANALNTKYKKAEILNKKIEILERLNAIGILIHSNDLNFTIKEADKLIEIPDLTYIQKLRLEWLQGKETENESEIAEILLKSLNSSSLTPNSSFIMATLAQISDLCGEKQRDAILNRYFEFYDAALQSNNAEEIGKLLTLAAYWNSNPAIRSLLVEAANRASIIIDLSLPELRLNAIATEVYTRIDNITGKYNEAYGIPA